ncbi:ATP-binding protein [Terasakiella sp.]|uniref:sensor histidine kinase n=1 Tax=Terasakiella sp. TaxID=2034861 RepID=UPI003AA870F6
MSFRLKTILGIALIEIVLLSILVLSGLNYLRDSNENQLVERAQTSARLFSTMTTDAIVSMDLATLDEMVEKAMQNPGMVYIRVRNAALGGENVISQSGDVAALERNFIADMSVDTARDDKTYDIAQDVVVGGQVFGRIELGLDIAALEDTIADAQRHMLSVALIEIVLVGIFGFLLGGILTRQLARLQNGARRVAQGDFGHVIQVQGRDELADTASSFNEMSKALASYASDLEQARQRAEDKRAHAESILQDAMESVSQGVWINDADRNVVLMNRAFIEMYNLTPDVIKNVHIGKDLCDAIKIFPQGFPACSSNVKEGETPVSKLEDGRYIMHSRFPLSAGGNVWVGTDITQVMQAEEKNRQLERELLQSQKMESIGTLAGGIAHEINTPIQYIGDNIRFMGEAVQDLMETLDGYLELEKEAATQPALGALVEKCAQTYENADIEFIRDELPLAVEQSLAGVKQVSHIVMAMKEFAHPSSKEKSNVDLNRVIERSCAVCKNEWKTVAQLELDLDPDLPEVMGQEGDLNQVVLNMVVNAAHAITAAGQDEGIIALRTFARDGQVVLVIEDNGTGVPDEIKERVFDPFFTTKEVGKGTGQGLAISRDIIVSKHGGELNVGDSQKGGAFFEIVLPTKT